MPADVTIPTGVEGYFAGVVGVLDLGHQRLKEAIAELKREQLETTPLGFTNSIATLVVHICSAEIRLAYAFTGAEIPADLRQELLMDEPRSPLPDPVGLTARNLIDRLEKSRAIVTDILKRLQLADLDRVLMLRSGRQGTGRWFLSQMAHHQATHLGQIQMIIRALEPPGFM